MGIVLYILILLFTGSMEIVLFYCLDYIEYKKPLEEIRRNRIERLSIQKIIKENKIYKLRNRTYSKEKTKEKAEEKAERLENEVVKITVSLEGLNNFIQRKCN